MTTLPGSQLVTDSSLQITSTRSITFGGDGGSSFDDSHQIEKWGTIRQIAVRHASEVDSIGILWASGNFRNHGGIGGTETVINLEADEFISSVSGRSGDRLDQITFHSNKKTYGPFGGLGGDSFRVDFSGKALHFLFGRSGSRMDQLGFGFGDQPPALPTNIGRSGAHGGTGGEPFDDLSAGGYVLGKIMAITVRHGRWVDKIAALYEGQSNSNPHGGGGGTEATFTLDNDEWLAEIKGCSGAKLDQVQFVTTKNRTSPPYGGNGGSPFALRKDESIIKAFFGRSGSLVDQLGVYFENAKPTLIEVISVEYDMPSLKFVQQEPWVAETVHLKNKTSSSERVSQTSEIDVMDTSTTEISETSEVSVQMRFKSNFLIEQSEYTFGFREGVTYMTGSTHAKTKRYRVRFDATVPPNSEIKGTCIVRQGRYDVPYTATAKVHYQDRDPMEKTLGGILMGVATASVVAEYEPVGIQP